MKFNQNISEDYNSIVNVSSELIRLNNCKFDKTFIVTNNETVQDLNLTLIADLKKQHITQLLSLQPEIIIIGSGLSLQFPNVDVLQEVARKNLGLEVMNNQSAARTYNVLVAEGRKVACLLILHENPHHNPNDKV